VTGRQALWEMWSRVVPTAELIPLSALPGPTRNDCSFNSEVSQVSELQFEVSQHAGAQLPDRTWLTPSSHRKRLLLSGRKLTPAAGPSGRCCVVERPLGGGRGGMVRSYPHLTFPRVACTRRPRHCALDAHSGVSGR